MENPYLPPNARVDDVQPAAVGKLASLTKWVVWGLYAQLVISVVALISGALEHQLLVDFQQGRYGDGGAAQAAGEANDQRQMLIGFTQMFVFIASGVLILMWIYRANANARQLGAEGMQFTPRGSVVWYFVPLANLFMPYRALREIWQASAAPHAWTREKTPRLFPLWWASWIVSGMAGQVAMRMVMSAKTLDALLAANVASLASEITSIPLLLVLVIVKRIAAMQARHQVPDATLQQLV
jgi:hypothetical protein